MVHICAYMRQSFLRRARSLLDGLHAIQWYLLEMHVIDTRCPYRRYHRVAVKQTSLGVQSFARSRFLWLVQ
jgi:hypothetical protein